MSIISHVIENQDAVARRLIQSGEGHNLVRPTNVGDHTITLGYGYTFIRKGGGGWNVIDALIGDLADIGISLSQAQETQLDNIAAALSDSNYPLADQLIVQFQSAWTASDITEAQAETLFSKTLEEKKKEIKGQFRKALGQENGDRLYDDLTGSREMAGLLSLSYNAPVLIGAGLVNALWTGNRAEAWFQVRYGSNSPNQASSLRPGLAKRHFAEAEFIGLFFDPAHPTDEEVTDVFQMLQTRRKAILAYEGEFGSPPDGTAATNGDRVATANRDFPDELAFAGLELVPTLVQALNPARNALLERLKGEGYADIESWFLGDALVSSNVYMALPGLGSDLNSTDYQTGSFAKGAADLMMGGDANDTLTGGLGNDVLVGGFGMDRYNFATGDGLDTLVDAGGLGELWIDDVHYRVGKQLAADSESWFSEDGKVRFARSGDDLLVFYGQRDRILIKDYRPGALGLALETFQPAAVPQNPARMGSNDPDFLEGTLGDDLILGLDGDDSIQASGAENLGGNDTLVGGAGSDRLFGGAGNDRIHAYELGEQGPANPLGSNGKGITGDWLDGRAGDDFLAGSGGQDGLFGGAGADTLVGGGGDDFIFADTTTSNLMPDLFLKLSTIAIGEDYQKVASVSAIGKAPLGGLGGNDVVFAGEGNDFVDGYAGDDYIEGNAGEDYLGGSMGNDTLLGGTGNDTLVGDGFDGLAPVLPSARIPGHLHGNDFLMGGEGHDLIQGNGGDDRLFGDEGNDTLYGDDLTTPAEYHGNDLLVGGAGSDTLHGGGRNDTLLGGLGNDMLEGDYTDTPEAYQGADLLDGGAGRDTLLGYGGNDTLYGGEGIDYLSGGTGDNLLDGGAGDDVLEADTGNDRYVFNRGYGNDSVYDKGGRNVVEFGTGISLDALTVDVVSQSGGDWLYLSADGDTLRLYDYQKWAA